MKHSQYLFTAKALSYVYVCVCKRTMLRYATHETLKHKNTWQLKDETEWGKRETGIKKAMGPHLCSLPSTVLHSICAVSIVTIGIEINDCQCKIGITAKRTTRCWRWHGVSFSIVYNLKSPTWIETRHTKLLKKQTNTSNIRCKLHSCGWNALAQTNMTFTDIHITHSMRKRKKERKKPFAKQ